MVLLADNDIVLKLAAFGLLEETIKVLSGEEVFVLDTARHRLRKPGRQTRKTYSPAVIAAALEWTEAATPLTEAAESDVVDALVGAEYEDDDGAICRIDAGELILFSHAFHHPLSHILTGDKKSLMALGHHRHLHPGAMEVHKALRRRVLCLEAAIYLQISALGFDRVCDQVAPARSCDKSMQVVFGAGTKTQEANAFESLNSYLAHLEQHTGENWLWRPERGKISQRK